MKRLLLLLLALLSGTLASGQKTEAFVSLNSGLFSFRGVVVPDNVRITSYLSVQNNQYDNSILLPTG